MNNSLPPRPNIPSFWDNHKDTACLHLGENPFPPTPKIVEAIAKASFYINRYPDTNTKILREKLAEYIGHEVQPANLLAGNGSDELIDLAVTTFCRPGDAVATFIPSFFVYAFAAQRHGVEVISYSRTNNYHLPAINELAWQNNIPLTFIANPNNPTGTLSPREQVIEYIQHAPGIVVVDECYYEFGGETVVDLIHNHKNLIVFRSLSKSFGLAGLRLGYLAAHESLADRLARAALTFPVNALAQAAGTAALDELDIHRQRIQTLIQDRDTLQKELEALGLAVLPSATNFLLTFWPKPIENPSAKLAGQGILVSDQTKNMQSERPALRIALGTNEENARLVGCVRGIMKNAGVEG